MVLAVADAVGSTDVGVDDGFFVDVCSVDAVVWAGDNVELGPLVVAGVVDTVDVKLTPTVVELVATLGESVVNVGKPVSVVSCRLCSSGKANQQALS